ncbi:MAG: YicC family protein [Bacteroidetes bacterium]|nr:YicC family protein [Bacteroidota bacterium]
MTGFGRSKSSWQNKTIIVEIRSLNSKFFDLRSKTPQNYRNKEADIRKILTEKFERGKIDLVLEIQSESDEPQNLINKILFEKYYRELLQLKNDLGMGEVDIFQSILRLPNVVATGEEAFSEEEWEKVLLTIHDCIGELNAYREKEGQSIEADMKFRIEHIQDSLSKIPVFESDRIQRVKDRLRENLALYEGREKVDENRFEQEIIYFLEKMDITEEKLRLSQNCFYFLEELASTEKSKGRKLGFISQEIGREINTLGAKANHADIQKLVISMKDELEKIKEQVANVL